VTAESRGLSRGVLAAYAAPAFSQALIHGPVGTVIQGIYGTQFGLPLAAIGAVLLVARIFDAITDPLIGFVSDRVETRWGHRKPWLVAGSLIAVVACWKLYVPPADIEVSYFLLWFLLAYLGWTISEIPYRAWLAELSDDYNERTRIATWRTFARYLGFIAFYGIPFLPLFESTEFTAETLKVTAILAAVALPLTAAVAAWRVPRGRIRRSEHEVRLRQALPAALANKPLLWFLLIYALTGTANGMAYGMLFFFVGGYLGMPETLALLFVLGAPVGALAMPAWGWLARQIGKQRTWAYGYLASAGFMLAHLLVPPGPGSEPLLVAVNLGIFLVSPAGLVIPAAMLADIVDYGRWKFRADYAGSYNALQTMMEKGLEGLGAAIGLAVAGWMGFNAEAPGEDGRLGLLIAFPLLPAVLTLISVPLIWRFPITERRQRAIARRLDRRENRP